MDVTRVNWGGCDEVGYAHEQLCLDTILGIAHDLHQLDASSIVPYINPSPKPFQHHLDTSTIIKPLSNPRDPVSIIFTLASRVLLCTLD